MWIRNDLFGTLYRKALEGRSRTVAACWLITISPASIMTGFEEGRPLFVRNPERQV